MFTQTSFGNYWVLLLRYEVISKTTSIFVLYGSGCGPSVMRIRNKLTNITTKLKNFENK